MQKAPPAIVYDSGEFPLWFRIAALILGIGGLCLGAVAPLLGGGMCISILFFWICARSAQLQILFDATRRELIMRTPSYLRPREHHIALAGAKGIHIRLTHTGFPGGGIWRVSVDYADGRSEGIVNMKTGIKSLSKSLAVATGLPISGDNPEA